jgi:hypothetical protein
MNVRGSSELNDDDILRRLEFLLNEAKQPSPILDKIVVLVLRQLGNYFWTKGDSGSTGLYKKCPCRSKAAYELSQTFPKDWYKGKRNGQQVADEQKVENDHWEPIWQLWKWICQKTDLTVDDVKARILRWPIVVVAKNEHKILNNSLEPEERYRNVLSEFFILGEFFSPGGGGWLKIDLQELMELADDFAVSEGRLRNHWDRHPICAQNRRAEFKNYHEALFV